MFQLTKTNLHQSCGFNVTNTTEVVSLKDSDKSYLQIKAYPIHYKCRVAYRIYGKTLRILDEKCYQ